MRAEKAALSLSKPFLPLGALAATTSSEGDPSGGTGPIATESTSSMMGITKIPFQDMKEPLKRLLAAAPAYPGGVGGRLVSSRPSGPPFPGEDTEKFSYRMVFDEGYSIPPVKAEEVAGGLPIGLEAIHDEKNESLSIRQVLSLGSNRVISGDGIDGDTIARIEALRTVSGGREASYRVILDGIGSGGELMAVRVSTHPTRLSAPREIRAVLLSSEGEGSKREPDEQEDNGYSSRVLMKWYEESKEVFVKKWIL